MKSNGFTLIELLVAMTIGLVVMAAVSMTFRSQQRSYLEQEQVAAMQQNVRAAMYYMEKDIKTAGCDPIYTAKSKIETANDDLIWFTRDIRGATMGSRANGESTDPDENIQYFLQDSDGDGDLDLMRDDLNDANTPILIAENIPSLNFIYRDGSGAQIDDGGGDVLAVNRPNIRSVDITLVAARDDGDPRTRTLSTRILCRNLGL